MGGIGLRRECELWIGGLELRLGADRKDRAALKGSARNSFGWGEGNGKEELGNMA